mmetsp:Transcript_83843/g.166365  ORF Transcript_83843/g.166365 Transcript_83843/m.166365 type:complete len:364 (+) Transcript_83843:96-1187(+)
MVDIRLDALEVADMPQDIFLSVRVGETQKLSKLSSSRIYKFPSVQGRRFGKIEVFRRIGACTVDVDPVNSDPRNVSIGCGEDALGVIGFSVAVESKAAAKKGEEPKKDDKMKAAKDYLQKHGLEMQLSEAMQAVLRERPDAPAQFLANKLLAAASNQAAPPLQPKTGGTVVKAAGPPPPLLPFRDYYASTFQSLDSSTWENCYSKFPRKQAKPTPLAGAAPALGTKPFRLLPSCGTWIAPLPKTLQSPTISSKEDTPVYLKPSVGTWMNRIPRRMRQLPAPPPTPTHLKPSVGTWLNRLPPKPKKQPQKNKFQLKPSVGTWLAVIPPLEEGETGKATGVFMSMHSRVGPAFASLGLPNNVLVF